MSRSARLRLLVPIAVCSLLLGLAACGDTKDSPKDPVDTKPPTELVLKVLKEGDGEVVKSGDPVTIDYQGTNWTSGEVFDQSYGKQPATFTTDGVVPGFGAALVGQKVGTQLVVGIPPEFGYGSTGQPSVGISGTDTLVFIIEIKSAGFKATECDVKPGAASNAVQVTGALGKKAVPTFSKPLTTKSLQRTVVTAGKGPVTKGGDILSVLVAIYNGRTGKKVNSSPATLRVGEPNDPAAFQAGISCVKVGSRVVTVFQAQDVPGSVDGKKVKATDAIVLVTDIIKLDPSAAPTLAPLPEVKDWENPPTVEFNGTAAPTLTLP